MQAYMAFTQYVEQLEEFYANLAEVAVKQGYLVDFLKAEALPCNSQGQPLTLPELMEIYGDDLPVDWKWRYSAFLEDDECLKKVFRTLTEKGYETAFNFTAPDAFLGNIAIRIDDKWFAIGECKNYSAAFPYARYRECSVETACIEIMKLWHPFYVLSNIKRMELQLSLAQSGSKGSEPL